jgi:hypothetical protein
VVICHSSNPKTGETGHFYERDGVFYPSVTTILEAESPEDSGGPIAKWKRRNKNWRELQKRSQIVGTIGHFRILNSLADMTIEIPDIPVHEFPEGLEDWLDIVDYLWASSNFEARIGYPRQIETTLVSNRYKFAGKPDLRCPVMGADGTQRLAVVDLKTSNAVYDKYLYQLAAYGLMMEESPVHGRFPDIGIVINLSPYEDKNPTMVARVSEFPKQKLLKYAAEFIEMAESYHKRFGDPSVQK